jgi:hypothetical protein
MTYLHHTNWCSSASIVIGLRNYEIKRTQSIKAKNLSLCSIKHHAMKTHGSGDKALRILEEVSG